MGPKGSEQSATGDAPASDSPPGLENLLGYHLRRASIVDLAGFAQALGDEIKTVPFTVLCMIRDCPGITAAEIGRRAKLQRANLAPMLADLDARGLIARLPDREDHRVQRLHLTPEGAEAAAAWYARVTAQEEQTFGALNAEERGALRRLLARVWQTD
ncbi:MarR family winged helix-turn-helix transcriptional regulator [Amaricoccus solimangrovi]|uniref:MarR family transcriptional regulator n=1 Tax=Amaricoccus solimangrovi TaxID=2589815 RepID=A0A501WQZ3_9RHOB|nr:MarR family transcriptional regulator [Amaricoccus solimangrovi]TPE48196.1 MarR family transcriptional regulator [Amaricoccus solimangrovi]